MLYLLLLLLFLISMYSAEQTRVRYLTPGASVGHVRATRAGLPCWVRTGRTGRLAPRAPRTVRTVPAPGVGYVPRTVATQVLRLRHAARLRLAPLLRDDGQVAGGVDRLEGWQYITSRVWRSLVFAHRPLSASSARPSRGLSGSAHEPACKPAARLSLASAQP